MAKKSITFTCPWCFEDVDSMSLHFRCHPSTRNLLGFEDEPDRVLMDFRSGVAGMEPGLQPKALSKESPGVKAITEKNPKTKAWHLVGLRDMHMNTTTVRLCSHCHNPLPASCGKSNTKIISLLGYTKTGKTVFLVSLLEWLTKNIHIALPGACFGFIDASMGDWFHRRMHELNDGNLWPTEVCYIEPIIGELKLPNGNAILLSFYDFPGEADVDQMRVLAQKHINKADAWMYLYDLTRTNTWWEAACRYEIRSNHLRLQDPAINAAQKAFLEYEIANLDWMRQNKGFIPVRDYTGDIEAYQYIGAQDWLQARLEHIIMQNPPQKKKRREIPKMRPIAVVGTKSDEIANIAEEFLEYAGDPAKLKSGIAVLRPTSKKLDMHSIDQVHKWMVATDGLLAGDANLRHCIDRLTSISHYFAVSSLGCAYAESIDDSGVLEKTLPIEHRDPWRIAEPLLWLLDALDLYSI